MARRTAASSIDLTTTEVTDRLGLRDGSLGFVAGIEVGRGGTIEPVRVAGGDVVFVEGLGRVDQGLVRAVRLGQTREQDAQRVAPGVEMTLLEQGLDGLLGRLVGSKGR